MFAIEHRQTRTRNLLATGEPSIDVECCARDPVPSADLLGLRPRIVLAQHPDDLLLAEAAPFHRPSPFSRRTLPQFGRVFGEHATIDSASAVKVRFPPI